MGAFAGIAAAAPVAFMVSGSLMGVCAGCLIPVALAAGAGGKSAVGKYAWAALTR